MQPLPGQLAFDDAGDQDGATATEVERPLPGDGNGDCEVGTQRGGAPSEGLRWLPWLCFDLTDDEDLAAERFAKRFGTPPRFVLEWDGLLRIGPVPEGGAR